MRYAKDTPMELAALPHPTANRNRIGSVSEMLKSHGYVIVSRPTGGENIWKLGEKGETLYTQTQALALCKPEKPS